MKEMDLFTMTPSHAGLTLFWPLLIYEPCSESELLICQPAYFAQLPDAKFPSEYVQDLSVLSNSLLPHLSSDLSVYWPVCLSLSLSSFAILYA